MKNDNIIIERFSKKRYITYKAKGIPFHVVCDRGLLCEVKAFDCGDNHDKVLVERTYKWRGKNQTHSYYANQKSGCTGYSHQDGNLFIYRGPWFEYNDLVVCTEDNIRGRYIFLWNKILPKEERFLACWKMYIPFENTDFTDFAQCLLGCDLKDGYPKSKQRNLHFRLANDKDIADYSDALRKHRIIWAEDGRFYHYPLVGDHYYEIFFNHGVADFRERILENEDTRPESSRLIMECDMTVHLELREKRVKQRVYDINKALGLNE